MTTRKTTVKDNIAPDMLASMSTDELENLLKRTSAANKKIQEKMIRNEELISSLISRKKGELSFDEIKENRSKDKIFLRMVKEFHPGMNVVVSCFGNLLRSIREFDENNDDFVSLIHHYGINGVTDLVDILNPFIDVKKRKMSVSVSELFDDDYNPVNYVTGDSGFFNFGPEFEEEVDDIVKYMMVVGHDVGILCDDDYRKKIYLVKVLDPTSEKVYSIRYFGGKKRRSKHDPPGSPSGEEHIYPANIYAKCLKDRYDELLKDRQNEIDSIISKRDDIPDPNSFVVNKQQ